MAPLPETTSPCGPDRAIREAFDAYAWRSKAGWVPAADILAFAREVRGVDVLRVTRRLARLERDGRVERKKTQNGDVLRRVVIPMTVRELRGHGARTWRRSA